MIRVLVADDDKLARKGIIALMNWSKYGMEVVGDVQNGKIALDFVQAHPVDLVFVDIDMPEMDGIEFMRQCRQIKPDIRFVVLTFYEEYSYARAAIQMECLDYISKAELEMTDGDTVLERIQKRYLSRTPTKPDASSCSPSSVYTSCPSALAQSTEHDKTGVPSKSTVQSPQFAVSQPRFTL